MSVYLFVLCSPYSGSTLLWKIIATSKNVSALPDEGQFLPEVEEIMRADPYGPDPLPWPQIKSAWHKYWDSSKDVLLEKSPPNLTRVDAIEAHFQPIKHIALVRTPYATIEGLVRRGGDLDTATEFAMRCLRFQLENSKRSNTLTLRYEELANDPASVAAKITSFVPELGTLTFNQQFRIKGKTEAIQNKDRLQIQSLLKRQISRINERLDPEIMKRWDFEYVYPDRFHNVRYASKTTVDWLNTQKNRVFNKLTKS